MSHKVDAFIGPSWMRALGGATQGGFVYAVLLMPIHGELSLVTVFSSRCEFLLAMDLPDTLEGWLEAQRDERVVFEMTTADDVKRVIEEVWQGYADRYDQTVLQLTNWIVEEPATEQAPSNSRRSLG